MSALLEQLAQRLEALDCLARPTKRAILDYAREHFTAEDQERYLIDRLDFIERYLARFEMPAFRKLCVRLASEEDRTAIQSGLGVHESGGCVLRFGHPSQPRSQGCSLGTGCLEGSAFSWVFRSLSIRFASPKRREGRAFGTAREVPLLANTLENAIASQIPDVVS